MPNKFPSEDGQKASAVSSAERQEAKGNSKGIGVNSANLKNKRFKV